jgi:peptide/nickel transport system ATP-binding protein
VTEPTTLFSLDHVGLVVGGRGTSHDALCEVTFSLAPHERVGIVGPSGAGKSSLVQIILGLKRPTSGTYRYRGIDLSAQRLDATHPLRREVGAIFQDPIASLDPEMTIARSVAEPMVAQGLDGDQTERVNTLLQEVGLTTELAGRYPGSISGGQAQRACIARALVSSPQLLVADEPTSALDAEVKTQILALLAREVRNRSLALLVVSHDLPTIRALCQRVIELRHGRIVRDLDADAYFAQRGTSRAPSNEAP